LITGAVSFASSYLPAAVAGGAVANATENAKWGEPLLIPFGGPFVAIATANTEGLWTGILVLNGIVQTAGAGVFIVGLVTEETYLSRIKVSSFDLPVPRLLVGPASAALEWQF
jgi:hypothetical protein